MVNRTATGTFALAIDATSQNTPPHHGLASMRKAASVADLSAASGRGTNQFDRSWERPNRTLLSGVSEEIDVFDFSGIDVGFGPGNDRVGQPLVADEVVTVVVKQVSGVGRLEITPGNNNGWTPIGSHTVTNDGALRAGGVLVKHLPHSDAFAIANGSSDRIRFAANGGDVVYSVYLGLRSPDFLPIDIDDLRMWMRADIGAETGGSRKFVASNLEYFSVADTADLDFGTGDFTVECWVKRLTTGSSHAIISKGLTGAGSFQLRIKSSDEIEAVIRDTAVEITHTTSVVMNDTDWHHVVWVADRSGNSTIYLDGSVASGGTVAITTAALTIDNSEAMEIGRSRSGSLYANGDLARCRLWKGRSLTAADVADLYNGGEGLLHNSIGTALEVNLVAAYDLIEAGGNATERVNSYTGTDTNTVTENPGPGLGAARNSDRITQWNDRSLNARILSQSDVTKRPLWIASAINSQPALRFDGTDDFLRLAESYLMKGSGTVAIVYQLTSAVQDDQTLFSVSDEATNVHRIALRGYNVAATPNINTIQTQNDVADNVRGDSTVTSATTYITIFSSSGTAYTLRLNGAVEVNTVITGGDTGDWFSSLTGADNVIIGALVSNSEQDHLKGDIAEIAVYDHALTDAELSSIESYLATRYGVTLPT